MAQWSLRTNLVAVVAVAFLPVLGLSGLSAYQDSLAARTRRTERVVAAAEVAASGQRQLLEGSRRLLISACAEDAVQTSARSSATPSEVERCEGYFGRLMRKFPTEYSTALVTDAGGEVRCASAPAAVDKSLADRQVFKTVRDTKNFTVGTTVSSRFTHDTIIPLAVPVVTGDRFAGMCSVGIRLKAFADIGVESSSDAVLVDRSGVPLDGKPEMVSALPPARRIVEAIDGNTPVFTSYGQNGQSAQFHVLPLSGDALFIVAIVPLDEGVPAMLRNWGTFALLLASYIGGLLAIWIGAERWVVGPLRHVREFASRVSRGESITLVPPQPWPPELVGLGKSINEMAAAIASREGELRTGLEQRDHMLREIHHRVKNNLQMISSLLSLQAGEIRSPRLRRFFGDAQNRVLTLSILHRHLYERSSWSLVDFQQFISDLVRQITVARPSPDRPNPRYHIRAPIMAVGPDIAIPVGLIVTEAVSSALSHDFSAVAQPEIRIEATQKDDEQAELLIEDNGVDRGAGSIGPQLRGSFSATLLRGLSMQLGGEATIEQRPDGGVRIIVAFPLPREPDGDA
jgi:two-component sensor histidine kinase